MVGACALKKQCCRPTFKKWCELRVFRNAIDVSDAAAAILKELVARIAEDGEKGYETNQVAKKRVKRSWITVERFYWINFHNSDFLQYGRKKHPLWSQRLSLIFVWLSFACFRRGLFRCGAQLDTRRYGVHLWVWNGCDTSSTTNNDLALWLSEFNVCISNGFSSVSWFPANKTYSFLATHLAMAEWETRKGIWKLIQQG